MHALHSFETRDNKNNHNLLSSWQVHISVAIIFSNHKMQFLTCTGFFMRGSHNQQLYWLTYARHYKPRLVFFKPIFHCGLYFRAAYILERLILQSGQYFVLPFDPFAAFYYFLQSELKRSKKRDAAFPSYAYCDQKTGRFGPFAYKTQTT